MPVSSSTEHWIKPDALTINLNHFGDPDYLQVSVLAGAVVMAFKQDVIGYNAAHNYRTWPLEAANTYLETSSAYNVYARLTRSEMNAQALIVYDTVLRDIEGREIFFAEDGSENLGDASADYFFVFLGQISSNIDSNGQIIQREWIVDPNFGNLDTNQQKNDTVGLFDLMFKPHYDNPLDPNEITWIEALTHLGVAGGITMYANGGKLNIPSIYDGLPIDNETLYWEDVNGSRVLKAKGGEGGGGLTEVYWDDVKMKPTFALVATSGKYADLSGLPDLSVYATTEYLTAELKKYVTLNTEQTIDAHKNFLNGLSIGGLGITKSQDDVIYLDANLVVRGGITMFGTNSVDVPTIMDAIATDGVNLKVVDGVLTFVGKTGGGVADSVLWDNVVGKPSWIGSSKPSYSYSEISGTPTLLSSFTNDVGFIDSSALVDYLPTSSYTATDIIAKLKTVDGEGSGLDADLLDGVERDSILELEAKGAARISAVGWYRIAKFKKTASQTNACRLHLSRNYANLNNEAYIFDITYTYNNRYSITQATGVYRDANSQCLTKIRIDSVSSSSEYAYVDFYYSKASANTVYWLSIGSLESFREPTLVEEPIGTPIEFETAKGCKSALGFTGDLTGNASTATQLQTPRTIWGQSFDGSGNIDGTFTLLDTARDSRPFRIGWLLYNERASLNMWSYSSSLGGFGDMCLGVSSDVVSQGSLYFNSSTKNWGIGTNSPSAKLDVNGTLRATGDTTLASKLTLNGIPIYKSQDDVLYIDGNLAVRGGITMYATDAIDVPSIIDALPIASASAKGIAAFNPNDFSVVDGYVSFIGKNGVDESVLADYAKKTDLSKYLPLSGGQMTGGIGYTLTPDSHAVGLPAGGTFEYTSLEDFNNKRSFIGTIKNATNNHWSNFILIRHGNGAYGDSTLHGMYLIAPMLSNGNLTWANQYNGVWQGERVILDSVNWSQYVSISEGISLDKVDNIRHKSGLYYLSMGIDSTGQNYFVNVGARDNFSYYSFINLWSSERVRFLNGDGAEVAYIDSSGCLSSKKITGVSNTETHVLTNSTSRYVLEISSTSADASVISFCGTENNEGAHLGYNRASGFYMFNYQAYRNNPNGCTGLGVDNNARFFIGRTGNCNYESFAMRIDENSNMLVAGGITMYSDIRKKTKLQDVELTLQQIADAPLIEHYYNSDEKRTTHVGSIAQYWASMNDWFCKLDNDGYYTMEIQNAALASAISIARELVKYESKTDRKIRLLKQRVKELEDKIKKLENN